MVDIVQLVPKAQATAAQNCAEFVAMTRNSLTVFGPSLEFDATVWDVTSATAARGMGKKRHRITFSTLHSAASNAPVAMAEPFQSVAKGLIRYLQGVRPTQNQHQRLAALRALEHALAEGGRSPDICNADAGTFNRAAQLVAEEFSGAGAYRMGSQLELIAETVTKFRLSTIPILGWRQPLKRPGDTVRVGKEFEKRRAEKLPSAAALDAIPKAFLLAQALPDRVLTSIIAILCATPDRINEVLTLPLDCEVRQDRGSKGEAYGLRWWPSKGAEPMIKWVVPSMSGVVTEALDRLRNDLQEAHRIAAWYESNPSKLYLPVGTEDLRTRKSLSMAELADVVGLSNGRSARSWCESNNVS
ncbi:MAG: integrase, partial [Hyphomicrobiaceae bacterium]